MKHTGNQRWHEWKNYDDATDPATRICPPFGVVEIFGYQAIGRRIVLKGRSSRCFTNAAAPSTSLPETVAQGMFWNHAYNGAVTVRPGQIGLLTFDLPTWVAVVGVTGETTEGFATQGQFRFGYAVDAPVVIGEPWKLGLVPDGFSVPDWGIDDGGGINVFGGHQGVNDVAYVGGLPTWAYGANWRDEIDNFKR